MESENQVWEVIVKYELWMKLCIGWNSIKSKLGLLYSSGERHKQDIVESKWSRGKETKVKSMLRANTVKSCIESVESRKNALSQIYSALRKGGMYSIKIIHISPDIKIIMFYFGRFINYLNSFHNWINHILSK